jgi:hypothetical protein
VRLVVYVLTVWFLVSIPVALFNGRLCSLCEGAPDSVNVDGTDVVSIEARSFAHTQPSVDSAKSNTWQPASSVSA